MPDFLLHRWYCLCRTLYKWEHTVCADLSKKPDTTLRLCDLSILLSVVADHSPGSVMFHDMSVPQELHFPEITTCAS